MTITFSKQYPTYIYIYIYIKKIYHFGVSNLRIWIWMCLYFPVLIELLCIIAAYKFYFFSWNVSIRMSCEIFLTWWFSEVFFDFNSFSEENISIYIYIRIKAQDNLNDTKSNFTTTRFTTTRNVALMIAKEKKRAYQLNPTSEWWNDHASSSNWNSSY